MPALLKKRTIALLAAFGATSIYGLNHTIAKGVMPEHITPFGFIMLRVLGAASLFWVISIFGPSEKIDKKDRGRLLLCALFGMSLNMLAFFKGLELSTPINSSVLVTTTPIIVVVLSALFIREKVPFYRAVGIGTGLIGAVFLVVYGQQVRQDAPNIPLGNLLFLVNAFFFSLYLISVKKLLERYHPITLMKWLFLLGVCFNLPVALPDFLEVRWASLPFDAIWRMAFVVIGTTFLTYLFNVYALRQLKASTVSAFIYVQPLIAILYAVISGRDTLTAVKLAAACLVLLGVYLVSRRPKAGP